MYQGNLDSNKFLLVRVSPHCCSDHRHQHKPGRGSGLQGSDRSVKNYEQEVGSGVQDPKDVQHQVQRWYQIGGAHVTDVADDRSYVTYSYLISLMDVPRISQAGVDSWIRRSLEWITRRWPVRWTGHVQGCLCYSRYSSAGFPLTVINTALPLDA